MMEITHERVLKALEYFEKCPSVKKAEVRNVCYQKGEDGVTKCVKGNGMVIHLGEEGSDKSVCSVHINLDTGEVETAVRYYYKVQESNVGGG